MLKVVFLIVSRGCRELPGIDFGKIGGNAVKVFVDTCGIIENSED